MKWGFVVSMILHGVTIGLLIVCLVKLHSREEVRRDDFAYGFSVARAYIQQCDKRDPLCARVFATACINADGIERLFER